MILDDTDREEREREGGGGGGVGDDAHTHFFGKKIPPFDFASVRLFRSLRENTK